VTSMTIRNILYRFVLPVICAASFCLLISCREPAGEKSKSDDRGVETLISQIELNSDVVYQTIEGFGASGCLLAQDVGGWENIDGILKWLYDDEVGIGLNIYRYNIGAGEPSKTWDEWRSTQTVEVSPGVYDLDRDRNAITAMKKAVELGADTVILFANSPPARLTISGYSSGAEDGGPNLPPENEQEFAKYLVDITELMLNEGIPVKYLSPINEPQWNWKTGENGQEGCHYKPEQVISLSGKVAAELEKRSLPVKISIPESGKWLDKEYTLDLYKKVMEDKILSKAVDHWAVHSYWSNEVDKKIVASYFEGIQNMVPLHQTEWCEMAEGRDLGMDAALILARTVHEDLTILSVVSWQHWLAVSCYDYRDGLVYVDKSTREYRIPKRMWALGNYSKFIDSGSSRISVQSEDEDILVSAFISEQKDKTVVVAINPADMKKAVSISGIDAYPITVYETSDNHDCEPVGTMDKNEHWELSPRSVTTFVAGRQ